VSERLRIGLPSAFYVLPVFGILLGWLLAGLLLAERRLDALEHRIERMERWTTNGTLVITQDVSGSYRFTWPNRTNDAPERAQGKEK